MDDNELDVQSAIGSLSSLSVEDRWKYFCNHALDDVQKVISDDLTVKQFDRMTGSEIVQMARKVHTELEKVVAVFDKIKVDDEHIEFVYNTSFNEDWSNIAIGAIVEMSILSPSPADMLENIYDAVGLCTTIFKDICSYVNVCGFAEDFKLFEMNSDT